MAALVKKDFLANKGYWIMLALLIPVTYIANYPPGFVYYGLMIGLVFSTFYSDSKDNVNQFVVSLPVQRLSVVIGRYLFFLASLILVLGYQTIFDVLTQRYIPYFFHPPLSYPGTLYSFCGLVILMSLSIPFFFKFSYKTAIGTQFGLGIILMGLFLLVVNIEIRENWFIRILEVLVRVVVQYPLPITVGLAIGSCIVSFMISSRIYTRRDLVW